MLENMLTQVLPRSSYQSQYKFKNGEVVDIIIRVGDKILPIDSKFSMENFRLYKEAREDDAAESLKKLFCVTSASALMKSTKSTFYPRKARLILL